MEEMANIWTSSIVSEKYYYFYKQNNIKIKTVWKAAIILRSSSSSKTVGIIFGWIINYSWTKEAGEQNVTT